MCYSRHLAYFMPSYTVGTITTTYQCLNAAPANWTIPTACTSEASCISGFCCLQRNITMNNRTQTLAVQSCTEQTTGFANYTTLFKTGHNASDTLAVLGCTEKLNPVLYASLNNSFSVDLKSLAWYTVVGIVFCMAIIV